MEKATGLEAGRPAEPVLADLIRIDLKTPM
jgi:hypothetical protein